MSRFLAYNPDQAYLLPPSVKDVGTDHLAFFVHRVVERMEVSEFELFCLGIRQFSRTHWKRCD